MEAFAQNYETSHKIDTIADVPMVEQKGLPRVLPMGEGGESEELSPEQLDQEFIEQMILVEQDY